MKKIVIILIVSFFASYNYSFAQEDALQTSQNYRKIDRELPDEIKRKVTTFFKNVSNSKIKKAYEDLLRNSPLKEKHAQIKSLEEETKRAIDIYGFLKSFEPVQTLYATGSYIRAKYLGLHADYPVRWIFTFYKTPEKGWVVLNIKFDDNTHFYFEE